LNKFMTLEREHIHQLAIQHGFNMVGIARAEPSPTLWAYQRWIEQGMHADMNYMARPDRQVRRENLKHILPSAQTLLMVGVDYRTLNISPEILNDPTRGRIASYAWGVDYHDILTPRLQAFAETLRQYISHESAVYVDTGAILERSHAQQAGLGFIGKNTMLIHPRRGSYFFIGEILTSAEVDTYDTPHKETMCGNCTRCLSACPTDAFPQPHVLDSRLCISYHTIENKGMIPLALRAKFGNWVYGCDVCQEVCPFQRFSPVSTEIAFTQFDMDRIAPPLEFLLTLTPKKFQQHFANSAIIRIKRERMVRNACVCAGNSQDARFIPFLEKLSQNESALVQEHATWALEQL
jgi:epoxyqueuosine reductase